ATPAAIVVGAGKGAENGILIKGGEYLERTQKINTIVFDKTGTLTKGEPSVTDIQNLETGFSDQEILRYAAIAEKRSEHPLAAAIVKKASDSGETLHEADSFQSITGKGVQANYSGKEIIFGNPKILEDFRISLDGKAKQKLDELTAQGKTVMVLAINGQAAGIIAVA